MEGRKEGYERRKDVRGWDVRDVCRPLAAGWSSLQAVGGGCEWAAGYTICTRLQKIHAPDSHSSESKVLDAIWYEAISVMDECV